jgi:hypothetical protein
MIGSLSKAQFYKNIVVKKLRLGENSEPQPVLISALTVGD